MACCAAMQRLQCAVLAMRWLQACPARLARCCTNATRCCNRGAVRAFAMQLQLAVLASAAGLCPTGASASLAGYGGIRCRVVTDAFQVVKPCFSLRTGFGPAANEMANGSGRRHYCASATTIGDCYIVKYLLVHTPNCKIGSVNCSHIARPEEAALTKRGLRPGGGVDLGVAPAVLEDARS